MKRYIRYFLFSFIISGLTLSCSLDEQLFDTLPEDRFKTEEEITLLLEGAYGELNDPAAFKFWGGLMMLNLCADDFTSKSAGEIGAFGTKTYSGIETQSFWDSMYRVIRQCNLVLKKLEELPEQTAVSSRLIGDAHYLRGFAYYYLVRLYGGVPLRLDVVNYDSDFYLPRQKATDIYSQVFADFKEAAARLPLQSSIVDAERGRASRGAAQAMLASASLTFANYIDVEGLAELSSVDYYKDAINWSDSVINSNQYTLIDKYEDLFNVETQGNTKEIIFAVQFASDPNKTGQAASGSEFAFRFLPKNMMNVTGFSSATEPGRGGNDVQLQPYFYYEYYINPDYSLGEGDMDYRLETSFFTRWLNTANNRQVFTFPLRHPETTMRGNLPQPYLAKYVDPNGKDNRNHGNDFIVIRMAEIYMIKAEAINELYGPTAEAIEAFNQLRIRARKAGGGTPRTLPVDLTSDVVPDKDAFRLAVLKEKGLEFVGEGMRWFDLVRMPAPSSSGKATMFDYRFAELGDITKYERKEPAYNAGSGDWNPKMTSIWVGIKNVCEYQGERNKYRLFPIPKTEIDNNPSISYKDQNPGW